MAQFLLLHGAYQGGWIWGPVAERLRRAGHEVHAPSLDGCGERAGSLRGGITVESQAEEVARMLFYQDLRDVVLVGTSAGGMTLCKVAELARERVGRVVFADALALHDGERLRDIVSRPAAQSDEHSTGPTPEDAENRMFASLEPALRAWALQRYTQHPIAVFEAPVKLDSFWSQSWDCCVVWCRQSPNPPVAHQRRTAEVLNGRWHEIDTGHYPMLTVPDALADLILSG